MPSLIVTIPAIQCRNHCNSHETTTVDSTKITTSGVKIPGPNENEKEKKKRTTTNELVNREESTKQVIWSIKVSQVPTYLIF